MLDGPATGRENALSGRADILRSMFDVSTVVRHVYGRLALNALRMGPSRVSTPASCRMESAMSITSRAELRPGRESALATDAPHLLRVSIVGTSGSGKTRFAKQLASRLGSPCVELDALYWDADWTPRADFRARVDDALRGAAWVVDGNYSSKVRDIAWGRCTAIVWLDYSFARTFGRGVWRTFRRIVTRERLYGGNREKLRNALFNPEGIPLWILRTYRRNRRKIPREAARAEYAHASLIVLRTPAEADAFLNALRGRA
jgi:hypothetical protein